MTQKVDRVLDLLVLVWLTRAEIRDMGLRISPELRYK